MVNRKRVLQMIYIVMIVALGLASRRFGYLLPPWLAKYAGDVLWGLMVYFIMGFIMPRQNILIVTAMAISFSFLIEISQLYHAPWIDAIRSNRLGGLVLGYGFLWSDIVCYGAGTVIGTVLEWATYRKQLNEVKD